MKKYLKYGLLNLISFCFLILNVNAETVEPEDVPNSTYIIGSHMFDRNANDETGYAGQLTTKMIMLASTTIESSDLEDMIIYYKNPRGKWVDALTGEGTDYPTEFEIDYKNLRTYVREPVLKLHTLNYPSANATYYYFLSLENYEKFYLSEENEGYTVAGVEISEIWYDVDGIKRYSVVDTINPDSFYVGGSENETYVARIFVEDKDGNKIYSDYSNEIEFKSYSDKVLSWDEFEAITSDTTLGELKNMHDVEEAIYNLGTKQKFNNPSIGLTYESTSRMWYDFKGSVYKDEVSVISNKVNNAQFEFTWNRDSDKVNAKVYKPISYDEITTTDYNSITTGITEDELKTTLGEAYEIRVIYNRERLTDELISTTSYYTYVIDEGRAIFTFNDGKLVIKEKKTDNYSDFIGTWNVTDDENYSLEILKIENNKIEFTYSKFHNLVITANFVGSTQDGLVAEFMCTESSKNSYIVGRIRLYDGQVILDGYTYLKTENLKDLDVASYDNLIIGFNNVSFDSKSE